MRRTLILLMLCAVFNGSAQDTLFFKNGNVLPTQIIKIDSVAALIEYKLNEQSINQAIKSFDKIIYQGKEMNLDYWLSRDSNQNEDLTNQQILKANPYSYGKFAVSTNLTSLIAGRQRDKRRLFYENSYFSIEPEYWVNDRFSIKIPILIGLHPNKYSNPYEVNVTYNSWSYILQFHEDEASLPDPTIANRSELYFNSNAEGHIRELDYQFGITPKFYLTKNTKVSPYIGQSLNVGFVNLRTIDYFMTFSVEKNIPTDTYFHTFRTERQVISNSQTAVFKYEGMFGLNFNFTRTLNFSTEVGYSNINRATNKEPDRVYIRTSETDDFELVKTSVFNATELYSYSLRRQYFARVHLVYRFGGKKNELPN